MASTNGIAPIRVEAHRQAGLSRWLWLVKWLLGIPHYIVLVFLWIAFFVVTVIAFFAILFTGRYPRGLFEFNAGVLRWSWRVAFYAYGGLGTDRYPPFTLGEVPDYPATVRIAYPQRLSRGLIFVKWLLAVPHYLVVAYFAGSGAYAFGGGLIGVLVLFAGIMLLFANRYPDGIFDFVLGMDRWVLRVIPYVALMTDEYPLFRLDMGGAEPAAAAPSQP